MYLVRVIATLQSSVYQRLMNIDFDPLFFFVMVNFISTNYTAQ